MTREEIEDQMLELADKAWHLAREYLGMEDIFVTMSRHAGGIIFADAVEDFDSTVTPYKIKKLLDCVRHNDGFVRHDPLTETVVEEEDEESPSGSALPEGEAKEEQCGNPTVLSLPEGRRTVK